MKDKRDIKSELRDEGYGEADYYGVKRSWNIIGRIERLRNMRSKVIKQLSNIIMTGGKYYNKWMLCCRTSWCDQQEILHSLAFKI
jgi:hypothetical protein